MSPDREQLIQTTGISEFLYDDGLAVIGFEDLINGKRHRLLWFGNLSGIRKPLEFARAAGTIVGRENIMLFGFPVDESGSSPATGVHMIEDPKYFGAYVELDGLSEEIKLELKRILDRVDIGE